jgi:hypothetical protein
MTTIYLDRLEAPTGVVRRVLRDAALRILALHGHDGAQTPMVIRRARFGGFNIRYFAAEPDTISRRGGVRWGTPSGSDHDEQQQVIDIEVGEHLLGIGWRGDGPILHDRFVRGPWELEFLRAANMAEDIPGLNRVAPAAPESSSPRIWPLEEILGVRKGRLRRTVTFDVIGYRACRPAVATAGTSFSDLSDMVAFYYDSSRSADGDATSASGFSSFSIRAWLGSRPFGRRGPVGRPDLRYWVSPHGGARLAASLLLLLGQTQP